ncbi:MAG: TonB-dependent receptor [Flavobacterium sp.]|nr:TonB-dependent receptor [Flavobacterium sp.]
MTFKIVNVLIFTLLCQYICAQKKSIEVLDEVIISDTNLKKFSNSQSVLKITDSIISVNKSSLTGLLNYNSVIYFKENGLGMVSSPSFRGTTAQQTAVIWNGININSQLNGQTDFNTINTKDYNSISVRAGGGSAIYGSSAIGGSVHLNNELIFKNLFSNNLQINYSSFNTSGFNYKISIATKKISTQISFSRNKSNNDYPYLSTDKKNENGQYENSSLNFNIGYLFNKFSSLRLYSTFYESKRHFSGTLTAPSKSKYDDLNFRNLVEYTLNQNQFTTKVKLAFLSEKYKYFENFASSFFTDAKAETVIAKYDVNYKIKNNLELNVVLDYTNTKGFGTEIASTTREISSSTLLLKHSVSKYFLYEATLRKERTNNYKSPLLFSVGGNFSPVNWYHLKINASHNFRIPSFNDLYYQGSGNPELKPESSYQGEIGHEIKFKKTTFSVTSYYIKISDLLRWSPTSGGNWTPNNVSKVTTYGAEILMNHVQKFGANNFELALTYAYTVSEDDEKKKQLIYVPFHKFTSSLAYSIKNFTAYYQYLFNGKVFTSSDNSYVLDNYFVSNAGIKYSISSKNKIKLGFDVLNIFNEKYQSVSTRPMPGINYNFNITFNF